MSTENLNVSLDLSDNETSETEMTNTKPLLHPKCKNDLPEHVRKYWNQRHYLFKKYDKGILMDTESWYSVTPEKIAEHIAEKVTMKTGGLKRKQDAVIIDGCCGCGGNTIQFAKKFKKVIAVDLNPVMINCAKHNAKIYGVDNKIEFIVGDFLEVSKNLQGDVVFLSPPWGGPKYTDNDVFDVETMMPNVKGSDLFKAASSITPNIIFFVPRNVDKDQMTSFAGEGNFVQIESNLVDGFTKTITIYYGDLVDR